MTSLFESLPISFSAETMDVANTAYANIQRMHDANPADSGYTDLGRARIVESQLHQLVELNRDWSVSAQEYNDLVARLAALSLAWLENVING